MKIREEARFATPMIFRADRARVRSIGKITRRATTIQRIDAGASNLKTASSHAPLMDNRPRLSARSQVRRERRGARCSRRLVDDTDSRNRARSTIKSALREACGSVKVNRFPVLLGDGAVRAHFRNTNGREKLNATSSNPLFSANEIQEDIIFYSLRHLYLLPIFFAENICLYARVALTPRLLQPSDPCEVRETFDFRTH